MRDKYRAIVTLGTSFNKIGKAFVSDKEFARRYSRITIRVSDSTSPTTSSCLIDSKLPSTTHPEARLAQHTHRRLPKPPMASYRDKVQVWLSIFSQDPLESKYLQYRRNRETIQRIALLLHRRKEFLHSLSAAEDLSAHGPLSKYAEEVEQLASKTPTWLNDLDIEYVKCVCREKASPGFDENLPDTGLVWLRYMQGLGGV